MKAQIQSFVNQAGGPDTVRRLLLLFYQRMHDDVLVGYFFAGKDLPHIADKQADFILAAGDFIPRFDGKGPATAHLALPPIYTGHFDRRLTILKEVLTDHHVPPPAIQAWIDFEESFRHLVVQNTTVQD